MASSRLWLAALAVLHQLFTVDAADTDFPGLFDDLSSGALVEKYTLNEQHWHFGGTCQGTSDGAGVTLTTGKSAAKGSSWISERVAASSWEVRFWVDVSGDPEKPGKGMAFWITKNLEAPGILYGSAEKFNGVVRDPRTHGLSASPLIRRLPSTHCRRALPGPAL